MKTLNAHRQDILVLALQRIAYHEPQRNEVAEAMRQLAREALELEDDSSAVEMGDPDAW
jgi:hypothetical protein